MSITLKDQILAVLKSLVAPDGRGDVVGRGMVSDIFIADGKAFFSLSVPAASAEVFEPFRKLAEAEVARLDGISSAMVALRAKASSSLSWS